MKNEPAYPCPVPHSDTGMTLRDYFAAQALNGMLSYSLINTSHGNWVENCTTEAAARYAYDYAAAMLAERARR